MARRAATRLLLALILACALCGTVLTALHVTGARRITGPGGLLPAALKAAKRWARRLPRRNITAALWRALARSMDANFTGPAGWLAAPDDEGDGSARTDFDALVEQELVEQELFGDGADSSDASAALRGGGADRGEAAPALLADGLSLGAVTDGVSQEDEDAARADGAPALDGDEGNGSGHGSADGEAAISDDAGDGDEGAGGGGDDDDGDDDGDDEDDDDDDDVREGMTEGAAWWFGGAADSGSSGPAHDPDSVTLTRRRGFQVRPAPELLQPVDDLPSGAWLLRRGPSAPSAALTAVNATATPGHAGAPPDGTAECITGLDGFSLCQYTLACFNVPRQWSFSAPAASAAGGGGGGGAATGGGAGAVANGGRRTVTAHLVRQAAAAEPPRPPQPPPPQQPGGAPRRKRRHRPATFDRFWLDANSVATLDPLREGPIYMDGLGGDVRHITPTEAVSDRVGAPPPPAAEPAAAAGAGGAAAPRVAGGGGAHAGPVVWVDTLYVAAAPPPDDDPSFPLDADWRVASTLTFPLLSAAYLNATLSLGLPPLTDLLYLGGESTSLGAEVSERGDDWRVAARSGRPAGDAAAVAAGGGAAAGGALRASWDAAFLHGFVRFVAGHAAAAAAATDAADAPPAAPRGGTGERRQRRRGRRARADADDAQAAGAEPGAPSVDPAGGDLTRAGHVLLGRHAGASASVDDDDAAAAAAPGDEGGGQAAAGSGSDEGRPRRRRKGSGGGTARGGQRRPRADAPAQLQQQAPPGGGGVVSPLEPPPDDAVRLFLAPEDVVAVAGAGGTGGSGGSGAARVCARRAVSLGHKPLLVGGTAEANAFRLAAGAHVMPSAGLEWPYPAASERRGAPISLLLWDGSGRVENADAVADVARKYVGAGALARVQHVTPEQAASMSAAETAAAFNGAHILVALAGDGFVHSLFLPPRSAIILVHGYQAWRPLHARIGSLAGHNVLPLFSRLRGRGVAYGSTGTLTLDECEGMAYAAVADSPCALAYRAARVLVPLASFESALLDALALAGRTRHQHAGSPLDLLEGAPQAGMPIPPFYDAHYGAAISRAFCDGRCAPLDGGGRGILPGPLSASQDVVVDAAGVAAGGARAAQPPR